MYVHEVDIPELTSRPKPFMWLVYNPEFLQPFKIPANPVRDVDCVRHDYRFDHGNRDASHGLPARGVMSNDLHPLLYYMRKPYTDMY